jgi:hypothetical protein
MARELVNVQLDHDGSKVKDYTTSADVTDPKDIEGMYRDGIIGDHTPGSASRNAEGYTITVWRRTTGEELLTYPKR